MGFNDFYALSNLCILLHGLAELFFHTANDVVPHILYYLVKCVIPTTQTLKAVLRAGTRGCQV